MNKIKNNNANPSVCNLGIVLSAILIILSPNILFGAAQEYPPGSGNWYPGSYNQQSLALGDVQDAVNSASGAASFINGDIVHLKAGEATWGSTLFINKGITLMGAGNGTGGGETNKNKQWHQNDSDKRTTRS